MNNVVKMPAHDRAVLIEGVSQKLAIPRPLIEKDLWVCYTLDHLFNRSPIRDRIIFKGGTSLSKCFNLIKRFSEDIDLILDWRVLDGIRLEVGPLAAWSPSTRAAVSPYAAEAFPDVFERPSCVVRAAVPERTLWEKLTILHKEAHRPASKATPQRYSRHYYDVYRLAHSEVLAHALDDLELLEHVIAFEEKFYRLSWACLEEARPGTFKLVPNEGRIAKLAADYAAMREMLFGVVPPFSAIVERIAALEEQLNAAA